MGVLDSYHGMYVEVSTSTMSVQGTKLRSELSSEPSNEPPSYFLKNLHFLIIIINIYFTGYLTV